MTRLAITAAILAAVLLIASAPRPAAVIPSASLGNVQGVGNGETDQRLAGAPEAGLAQQAEEHRVYAEVAGANPVPGGSLPSGTPPPFTLPAPRPQHADATPTPKPSVRPTVTLRRVARLRTAKPAPTITKDLALTGTASWFCLPGRSACTSGYSASGAYAAAGPRLRAALGDWRGRTVLVTADGASVRLRLIDWCACGSGYLLDLYGSVFAQLARNGLSEGVIDVEVSW